jgi:TPR repeat protein
MSIKGREKAVCTRARQLLDPEATKDLTDEQIIRIYYDIYPRKPVPANYDEESVSSTEEMARLVASCIPALTNAQIDKGVDNRDSRAWLIQGDCDKHGLKNTDGDEERSWALYDQAAEMGNPEAMVAVADASFKYIARWLGVKDLEEVRMFKIPGNFENDSLMRLHLTGMWKWLEKSAQFGYKSYLLVQQTQQALKTQSWKVSETVKALVTKQDKKTEYDY